VGATHPKIHDSWLLDASFNTFVALNGKTRIAYRAKKNKPKTQYRARSPQLGNRNHGFGVVIFRTLKTFNLEEILDSHGRIL